MAAEERRFQWGLDNWFAVDRQAVYLVLLFLGVNVAAIALAALMNAPQSSGAASSVPTPSESSTVSGGTSGAAFGLGWVIAEVALAVAILLSYVAYTKAPDWIQLAVRRNAKVLIAVGLGVWLAHRGLALTGLGIVLLIVTLYTVTDHFDLYWILNNVFALALAIYLGAGIAHVLGVTALGVGLLGLAAYDHLFANKRDWMFTIAKPFVRLRIPVMVIKPDGVQFDWDRLLPDEHSGDGDQQPRTDIWAIGMADLALPAGFASAVAIATPDGLAIGGLWAAVAVVIGVGVACLRLRREMLTRGGGAGLPPLAAGTLGSYAVAAVAVALLGSFV